MDFDLECEWHFFATSHGKSACGGIGEVVKKITAKARLQRPFENQIFTPKNIYNLHFAKKILEKKLVFLHVW